MEKRAFSTPRGRLLLAAVAVPLFALVALVMSAQGIATAQGGWIMAPTPGVDYRVGNYCVQDCPGMSGANCTANDVRIASITPGLAEVCINVNDYASAQFKVELKTGATDRYDIGLFVATEGGSALSGDYCYHDFLQEASASGPWNFASGFGPFRATDPDLCADTKQTDPNNYYTFQAPVTFLCEDADNNGVVDPIHTCTSWDQNHNTTCNDVTGACPGTGSKCSCQDMLTTTVPILIYRGLDYGDLPASYVTTYQASPLIDGPRHSIQNFNNVLPPDTQAGIVAIWLGAVAPSVDYTETNGIPTTDATGDDSANTDDENGVTKSGVWTTGTNGGQFSVVVNGASTSACGTTAAPTCMLGYWVDVNGDGDFSDANESYTMPVAVGSYTAYFDIPSSPPTYFYARFRLYDSIHVQYVNTYLPTGLVLNGEVEDYRFPYAPEAVELASFTATPQAWTKTIRLDWETLTEVNNLGFNLYRAESPDGRQIRLNAGLIPSQGPGSPSGYIYSFVDRRVTAGRAYYYWLEAIDLNGSTQRFGPKSATIPLQLSIPRLSTP